MFRKIKEIKEKYRDEIFAVCNALFVLSIFFIIMILHGCGGGAGDAAVSPGVPSNSLNIELNASKVVETVGNSITLYASLYDQNGRPVEGVDVSFQRDYDYGLISLSNSTARTDSRGIASVTVTATGRTTVKIKATSGGVSAVKILYFVPSSNPISTLRLDVDGNGNGVYNEQDDFTVIADGRDIVNLRATFVESNGNFPKGRPISFDSDNNAVVFSDTHGTTDNNGQVYTSFTVSSKSPVITVFAREFLSGASDIVSISVQPVVAGSIVITADSKTVETGKTLNVKTCVFDTSGYPMPDNTYIRYSLNPADAGRIDLFGYTSDGCHAAVFTAGNLQETVTVTASSMGVKASTTVSVVEQVKTLKIIPTQAVTTVGTPYTFTVSGGVKPYIVSLSSSNATYRWTDSSHIEVLDNTQETVTVTVYDSEGNTAAAELTLN